MKFQLKSSFQPTGDQPEAIDKLVAGVKAGHTHQTLLGVTGSGKTFSIANLIEQTQKPTLVIAHNKTLAAQLYQEFRDFFPNNAVSYFVSYYDYYQPEAYIPSTDTYIEKEATINDEIDKLRLAATTNLLTRPDTIVVASVSCIYNLGSPVEYGKYQLTLVEGEIISRETLMLQLANLQYDRSENELRRGSFRIRGDMIQLWPAYEDRALQIDTLENKIQKIDWIDPIGGQTVTEPAAHPHSPSSQTAGRRRYIIYPAKHYLINPKDQSAAFAQIEHDLAEQLQSFESDKKIVEAYRLKQKVNYDLEMIREFGFVNGIENYSRYFDGREPGQPPFTLLDYFSESAGLFGDGNYLTVIDESHITLPQIRGMHHGDRSRKETLINYGFRLPSALDNRPLKFEEFMERSHQLIYVSATPDDFEVSLSEGRVTEQLVRPTGLIDPNIEIRPIMGQVEDLVVEIIARKQADQRILVTTLTKKMAEALTEYLNNPAKIDALVASYLAKIERQTKSDQSEQIIWAQEVLPIEQMEVGPIDSIYMNHLKNNQFLRQALERFVKLTKDQAQTSEPTATKDPAASIIDQLYPQVAYLHSDIVTLERSDILDDLRAGVYDVLVGINLLREGLDLPEVSLVAILDADKAGFLRSRTSLIQTMGRAARHQDGHVVLYADIMTKAIRAAIGETLRRRQAQIKYNLAHQITPTSIQKPIRSKMIEKSDQDDSQNNQNYDSNPGQAGLIIQLSKSKRINLALLDPASLTPHDKRQLTTKLTRRMNQAAKDMDFELAAVIRDKVKAINS